MNDLHNAFLKATREAVARTTKPSHPHTYGVLRMDEPSHTITGNGSPGGGPFSVSDPRPAAEGRYGNNWRVERMDSPAHTITGQDDLQVGAPSIADPRITCKTRDTSGIYGVLPWTGASGTIVGHACHDNGRFSVADPRVAECFARSPFPVILAEDGTWHRPLTTLECALLQGFPARTAENGTEGDDVPFALAGSKDGQRVKVGDAVPPPAAQRIAEQMLHTLLYADAGSFVLSSGGGVWVRKNRDGSFPLYLDKQLKKVSKRAKRKARTAAAIVSNETWAVQ